MMGMDGMMGGWGVFGVIGMLLNLLLLGGFLVLMAWAVVRVSSPRRTDERGDSAEDILRERFARGEIDAGEYRRSLETLWKDSPRRSYEDYVREADDELRSR